MEHEFEEKFKKLKSFMESLPSFSPATQKLIELSNDLNASPKDVVKAVRMDPVLTGRVFELVNSAFFGLPEKVTSLNRVVVYIGINTVKNIALSASVNGAIKTNNKKLEEQVRPLWKHCLAMAVCCKAIAKEIGVSKKKYEEYFIAGLLHDLGKIILVQCFFETLPHDGVMSCAEEEERYGINHNNVAYEILKKWNFTDELMIPIKNSHNPSANNQMANVIHLADYMTYKLELNDFDETPDEEDDESSKVKEEATEELELTEQKVISDYIPTLNDSVWKALETDMTKIENCLINAKEEIQKAELFLKA
jgi:putative nucleotidyltransferase with HDIG domain